MSLGKLIYQLYYKPFGQVRKILKTGIRQTAQIKRGKRQMTAAAAKLKEVVYANAPVYNVYFLTGKKYWFQTAFCLHSFQRFAGVNIHATIIDDGTFDEELIALVKTTFPTTTTIVLTAEIDRLLEQQLPEKKFPVLRQRRITYPHLRKLTDVHILPGGGPKLVLDSDMLFFHQPVELLQWLANPKGMLFMRDVSESYGYSTPLMKELSGATTIPERVNVGVAGIPSALINWPKVEWWTAQMLAKEGSSYLQEQALTAMIAANWDYRFLPGQEYKVLPKIKGEVISEKLHHYVADSKYDYFVKGWTHFIPGKIPV